jgi:large subunit ribosomal protein L18
MARGPTYIVKFKRRRQSRTDYRKRIAYLKSKKPRFVVRLSNKHTSCQFIRNETKGDVVLASARSSELKKLGYKGNTGNKTASYLTGLLCCIRLHADKSAVLDIGLQRSHPKGRVYAALLGAIESGMQIPHEKEVLPEKPNGVDVIIEVIKKPEAIKKPKTIKKPKVAKKKVESHGRE